MWVKGCGSYSYTGKQEELDMIWQLEDAMCDGREILRPEMIGKLKDEEEPLWLFGNALVKEEDGTVLQPDKEGIIWYGLNGYLPRSIKVASKSKTSIKATQVPTINLDGDVNLKFIKDIINRMEENWENKAVCLGVGWVIACLLSDEIHHKYGSFPLLFIGGKRESGKTTLAQWLMALGGQHEPVGNSLEGTTQPGAVRHLAWYSCLIYWMDEYRNNSKIKKWDGFFRNAYNRQSPSKGTLGAGVRSQDINAGILLSGEETPHDNALLSRCVVIPLVKRRKENKERSQKHYAFIENLRTSGVLSQLIVEVIKVKQALLPTILDYIDGWKKRLLDANVGERIALNYAIPAVCYDMIFLRDEPMEVRQEFTRWVLEESHRTELEKESEHMLAVFMEDLITIHEYLDGFYMVFNESGKRRIAIHFPTFYSKWTETYRRKGHEQFKRGTMLSYIREESYFIEEKLKRVNGKPMRTVILSLEDDDNPPDGLKYLADGRAESVESLGDAIDGISDDGPTPF